MRINKISQSDSFDLYAKTLSSFLAKQDSSEDLVKTASLFGGIADIMQGVGNKLDLSSIFKVDEFSALAPPSLALALEPSSAAFSKKLIQIGDAAANAAIAAKADYSDDLFKLFFKDEKTLKDLYKLDALYRAKETTVTPRSLAELGELDGEIKKIEYYLKENLPILKDPELLRLMKGMSPEQRGLDNIRDIDDLKRGLGLMEDSPVPTSSVGKTISEEASEEAAQQGARVTDDINSLPRPGAPSTIPQHADELAEVVRPIAEIEKSMKAAVDAGYLEGANKIGVELAKAKEAHLKKIDEALKDLKKKLRRGDLKRAEYNKLADMYKAQAKNLQGSTDSLLSTLGDWAKNLAAFSILKDLALAAGLIFAGKAGYDWYTSDEEADLEENLEQRSEPEFDEEVVTIAPEELKAKRAVKDKDEEAIQEVLSNPDVSEEILQHIALYYKKSNPYKLPEPYKGLNYVFLTEHITEKKVSENLNLVLKLLKTRQGKKFFKDFDEEDAINSQRALNDAVDEMLKNDLLTRGRLRAARKGRAPRSRPGLRERKIRKMSEDTFNTNRIQKLSHFRDVSLETTNNHSINDINLLKKADEMSKSYHKDAVKDLAGEDKALREYFTGLGRLYDAESEKRNPDYEELNKLHDETGRDLTLSAHPKAIRVSDAMGNGGLVENGLEQKEKLEEVALSAPTGNFTSRYAKLKNLLIKSK